MPIILNAANEIAVEAFLANRLDFPGIPGLVGKAMQSVPTRFTASNQYSEDDILNLDQETRAWCLDRLSKM